MQFSITMFAAVLAAAAGVQAVTSSSTTGSTSSTKSVSTSTGSTSSTKSVSTSTGSTSSSKSVSTGSSSSSKALSTGSTSSVKSVSTGSSSSSKAVSTGSSSSGFSTAPKLSTGTGTGTGIVPGATVYTTQTVTGYVTLCPTPTTFSNNGQTYTATTSTWITVSNCPGLCTISNAVGQAPSVVPIGSVKPFTNSTGVTGMGGSPAAAATSGRTLSNDASVRYGSSAIALIVAGAVAGAAL